MEMLFAVLVLVGSIFYLKSALGRWNQRRYPGDTDNLEHATEHTTTLSGPTAEDEFEFDDDEHFAIDRELSQIATLLNSKSLGQADVIKIENGMAASALYRLAKTKMRAQDFGGALATLLKSIALDPAVEAQWLLLAEIHSETNRVTDAKDALRIAEERFEQGPEAHLPNSLPSLGVQQSYEESWASQIERVKKKIREIE